MFQSRDKESDKMLHLVLILIVIAIVIYLIFDFLKNGKLAAGRRRKFMWLAVILLFLVNQYAGAIAVLVVVAITLISSINSSKKK